MATDLNSVSILLEALPYIRHFRGATIVIKFGGAAMEDKALRQNFARDIVLLQYVGIKPVVVHGGGPEINRMLKELSIPTEFVDGHRITDEAAMGVIEMVLAGKINKEIVALINNEGGHSVGISGRDGNLACTLPHSLEKVHSDGAKKAIPLGRVGKVSPKEIQPTLLRFLESGGYVPVIAPIATDATGHALNINADTMAGAVAAALNSKKLILLTDTRGVLADQKTLAHINPQTVDVLKKEKQITGGMIPKVDCCLEAIRAGVEQAHIIDGRIAHALLLEIFTDRGIGTMISEKESVV